ncbi:MAG: metalloregulator ArsR/SmtB family transcription factor [Planctomycetota bacterium]|nr:metalloregulator ArsR/SmtB family transcription factor [Planctomycetota bacterium]
MSLSRAARDLADVEAVFDALSHETRRHVLLVLHFRGGEMTAGRIAERFECSWPTTSRHLKVLVESGLVSVEKQGRERIYRLNRERLAVVERWLGWFERSPARP